MGGRRAAAALVLAVLLAAVPGAAHAEKTIGVSTARFDFSVAAGQRVNGELYVINDGDEPLTVMIYSANQVVNEQGETEYETPDPDDRNLLSSPATWVRLSLPAETKTIGNTPYLEMAPGENVLVQFDVVTPTQAPPGDHQVLLFFEMFDFDQAMAGTGSVLGGRIGSRLKIRVQGDLVEKLDVSPFVIPGVVIGNRLDYSCTIVNEGNIDKVVNASLVARDSSDAEVLRSEVATDTTVYAGQVLERTGRVDASGLLGRRTVQIEVNYDPEAAGGVTTPGQIVKERSVWFIPWWLFMLSVAVLGTVAVLLSWRQSVRSAARKKERRRAERLAQRAQVESSVHDLRE